MRPINRGPAPRVYAHHREARNDLIGVIGWYCSYCEMPIKNMPEVEHMLPMNQGGAPVDWDNFLLSCKYCNTRKNDHNTTLTGYFWPDTDNTLRAYKYQYAHPISPADGLTANQRIMAQAMIDLCGLDREHGTAKVPTDADNRCHSRSEAWRKALLARERWRRIINIPNYPEILVHDLADSIADQATAEGHFSIWMEVFRDDSIVRKKLIDQFPGTADNCFDLHTIPIQRHNGNL